ncbi:Lrp/AsnC family transcriptional regulator [Paenarthrobacter nicotinovorans]|uniref:Lrp/AsnC family transcriptional regulator n=1 Tax=Paenarthrobacter nicotinovorans TaxID=29320 RepID=UPI0007E6BD8A|nr:Lrp/AsnC family transcriptional regulator [Paenarthrobacter nicotinovorans]
MAGILDRTARRILGVLDREPRATTQYIAHELNLARGTVLSHLRRLIDAAELPPISTRIPGAWIGRPLRVFVLAEVDQSQFDGLVDELKQIPEIVECLAVSGASDLQLELAASDSDDVYRITQQIMSCRGIRRTASTFILRELIPRRMRQLL